MDIEHKLAYHCAPTFAGIKAANLLSLEKFLLPDIRERFEEYNVQFNCRGIYFDILRESRERVLLFVYRRVQLWEELCISCNESFLKSCGYDDYSSIDTVLGRLREKMSEGGFPHEIGVFLSYPLEDVMGFINFKGKNYKCSGYWKVYGDVQGTVKKFEEFKMCRDHYISLLESGMSLVQLLEAA
ncbi:MAG: DUF3793 family protein [Sedimentibacter sp.]|uniref:DUF3793 family protein n=1 Tax=Sedimentibacter sp. TaxID=1960295 RepID=UPI0031586A6D